MRNIWGKIGSFVLIFTMVFSLAACGGKDEKKITMSASALSMIVGEAKDLTATSEPADLVLTWSSSDEAVATYANGKVTAVAAGSAVITAKNGDVSATCTVTVTNPAPQKSITLSATALSVEVGTSKVLTATPTPADMTVTFKTSNAAVATYADGKVTGVGAGTATITAENGDVKATCTVTVTKKPDVMENEINKTAVMESELKELSAQDFAADAGIFSMSENAAYNGADKGIDLADQAYMYSKITMPQFNPKYTNYGDKAERPGFEGNARRFVRFEAKGSGGVEVYAVNESLEMIAILDPVFLTETSAKYQFEIPSMFSELVTGIVFKNPAPLESELVSTIESFKIVEELDPSDKAVYMADMFEWMSAVDKGNEPTTFSPATGWNGWSGISRGDLSGNCIAYLDSFGAALEYDDQKDGNIANEGVAMYGKVVIPANAKKITYLIAHVGDPSAYRIQLFDGTDYITLTESSNKVNAANVAAGEGWRLTSQAYNGTETYEAAIPAKYAGQTVMIIISAKYNNADGYGGRVNNIAFSSAEMTVPPAMSDGIDINEIDAQDTVTASSYDFAADMQGFEALWGAAYDSGAVVFAGAAKPEGASANGAIAAKLTVPAFKYLRVTVRGEAGKSVDVRVRMLDLEAKSSSTLLDWKAVTGAEAQVLQMQNFPTTFTGTIGFVIETRYTDENTAASLTLKKIEFAAADRNEDGYDFTAMQYVQHQAMPQDNKFIFDGANIAKWSVFTANDDSNTKGFSNDLWMQLQSTNNAGAYSALTAYRTTLGSFSNLEIKAGNIDAGSLTSMIRVRAMKADGTFVNFVTDGLTDENGWFNGAAGTLINDFGWGKLYTNNLTVPAGLENEEVLLIIEYDREISTNWNVLIEHLLFS